MADTTLVVLKGIVAELLATGGLTAITSTRIYSDIPQQTAFPYAAVEIESQPWTQDDASHMSHTIRVHGFSRKNSPSEAMNIIKQVYDALDRQEAAISVDSGNILQCIFDGVKTTFKDTDGITWHGVIEFNLIMN